VVGAVVQEVAGRQVDREELKVVTVGLGAETPTELVETAALRVMRPASQEPPVTPDPRAEPQASEEPEGPLMAGLFTLPPRRVRLR